MKDVFKGLNEVFWEKDIARNTFIYRAYYHGRKRSADAGYPIDIAKRFGQEQMAKAAELWSKLMEEWKGSA